MSAQAHYRVCNLCEAMCGIEIHHDENAIGEQKVVVKPDVNDPFSKGSMCPKAPALGALQFDESKLRQPVKRVGDEWKTIGWDEAYDTIEIEVKKIRQKFGDDAFATYLGNPIVHNLGMLLFVKTLTSALHSKNVYSATSMDQLPHHFAAHFMFGHEFRIPVPDIDRTDHMIIMGANPLASNGSIMTSAGVTERLKSIQQRGGKVVVIDPRKTETAKAATEHHFITPATDVFFLLAFLHVLYRDDHIAVENLKPHLKNEHRLEDLIKEFSPEAVESITNIKADTIEQIVIDFVSRERAVIYGRMGLSTQRNGGLCNWLINTINIVSGNFDREGGMMFPSPAIEMARSKKQPNAFGRWKSNTRGLSEFYGELPVSGMVDEFEADHEHKIRGFITICGNPVLSTPSGGKLEKSLPDLDFMFSIDNYINETTKHANIILPTPSGLEIDHFDLIFNQISVSNNVKFSEALFPVAKERPYDWQVLRELVRRFSGGKLDLFTKFATPRRVVNWGLMLGPYGKLSHPKRLFSGLSLTKVIKSKHGINLGPLVSRVPEGLITADKKINLAPDVFVNRVKEIINDEFAALRDIAAARKDNELLYFGRRHVNTNNSWMHQVRKLSRSKMVRCTAMINPDDAGRLKIGDGDDVLVTSGISEIRLPAEVTSEMMPGAICIPHGFGHHREGTRVPIASEKPGVSVNDITDHREVDPVTGNAAFSGQVVSVTPLEEMREIENVTGKPVTVLYGSRTGNAESIAFDVARAAEGYELVANVYPMDELPSEEIEKLDRVLIVCSTYGEGDMPDNAQALWDYVNSDSKIDLSGMHYSVLALGDTAYETFCEAGRAWDRRLAELGAKRISDRVDCSVDYTENAEKWTAEVLPEITIHGDQELLITQPSRASIKSIPGTSKDSPIDFVVREKRSLTSNESSKETFHYELAADGINELYEAGAILNILPHNDPELVRDLSSELNLDLDSRNNADLKTRLIEDLDLRTPSDDLVEMAGVTGMSQLDGLDVLDLVRLLPNDMRDTKRILKCLRPLMPRSYSIASSPHQSTGKVDLCVATVRYKLGVREYGGVGSTYLQDRIEQGETVKGYFVANKAFKLPENKTRPVIMIGPGTGLAPFRGFLQDYSCRKYEGSTWLFFGERNEQSDFLYREELLAYLNNGILNRLDLAFSRDQEQKIYVQHRMLEHGEEFFRWLDNGASVFVCGDAKSMANDVDVAMRDIIQKYGNLNDRAVSEYIEAMKADRRYVRDVY